MQEGRWLLRLLQERFQLFLASLKILHLLHHAGGRVVVTGSHDELHQLVQFAVDPCDLSLGLIDRRPPFHAQPIHLVGELVTEFLEQRGFHKVMPQRVENACLKLIAPNVLAIVAGALVACR